MAEERKIQRGALGLTVLWAVMTATWAVVFFTWLALREFAPPVVGVISAAALAVCAFFCALWMRRYLKIKRRKKTERRGGNDHER